MYRQFNVNPQKVLTALEFLLQRSDIYKEAKVQINPTWLQDTIKFWTDGSEADTSVLDEMVAPTSLLTPDANDGVLGAASSLKHVLI